MTVMLTAMLSSAAFAVLDPASGTSTPNGDFIFVPNQTNTASIEVVRTSDDAAVQAINVASGTPASMATSPDGKTLFVVVAGATGSRVRAYSIGSTEPYFFILYGTELHLHRRKAVRHHPRRKIPLCGEL